MYNLAVSCWCFHQVSAHIERGLTGTQGGEKNVCMKVMAQEEDKKPRNKWENLEIFL